MLYNTLTILTTLFSLKNNLKGDDNSFNYNAILNSDNIK
jgi:hypothetical protein